ncbi:MAG: hypothetical protein HON53_09865 [Planctomycetaceae bacterium]|jgi:hypothetical protein|nr:hypothetical protein [Planctomycetaceae bacterium]MBT6153837.1 hypothetical protein [Planctomycetaceae bacterium]MBT6486999.1 hypothetical protein [Planctomycetaceae bacterium]MBT6493105.1 hypothetical protein [Planctomycetaceae bacterium]
MRCWQSFCVLNLLLLVAGAGCTTMKTTDTARTAKEQLLISNAVDQALDKIDFGAFSGRAVFLQDKYVDCIDKNYLLGSIRHRAFGVGARVVDKQEDADIVLEARVGSVGTDNAEMFIGVPKMNVPGPIPISVPEVRLLTRASQTGTAKIGLVAYDAKSMEPLGDGGVSLARSDDNNWFVFGLGPYQNGSVRNEVASSLRSGENKSDVPNRVAFSRTPRRSTNSNGIRLTSGIEEAPDNRYRPFGEN